MQLAQFARLYAQRSRHLSHHLVQGSSRMHPRDKSSTCWPAFWQFVYRRMSVPTRNQNACLALAGTNTTGASALDRPSDAHITPTHPYQHCHSTAGHPAGTGASALGRLSAGAKEVKEEVKREIHVSVS